MGSLVLARAQSPLVTVRGAAGIQLSIPLTYDKVQQLYYDKVQQLYFQNPTFGFYLLRLTTERLLQNLARLEARLVTRELLPARHSRRNANRARQPIMELAGRWAPPTPSR
jgi:hypothetical protein